MTVTIFDRPDVKEFLKELSGLNNDAGNPRMKRIVHRLMSDLFRAIDELDITPDEYWMGVAWLNDLGAAGQGRRGRAVAGLLQLARHRPAHVGRAGCRSGEGLPHPAL